MTGRFAGGNYPTRHRLRVLGRAALRKAEIQFDEGEVVPALLENRAGELAALTAKLSEAKVNLRAIYMTGIVDTVVELAVVVDDPEKAKQILD